MPKCGYHPRMGIGLQEIGAGLADAVRVKALGHSRCVSEQLSIEKEEFSVVRAVVRKKVAQVTSPSDRARLEAFGAMLFLGEYFLNLQRSTISSDLHAEVGDRAEAFIAFLKYFDDVWKSQLLDSPVDERAENALSLSLARYECVAV